MKEDKTRAATRGVASTFDTFPHMNRLAMLRGEEGFLHLWYLLRHIATGDRSSGVFPYSRLADIGHLWTTRAGKPVSRKRLTALLLRGHGQYWDLGQRSGSSQYQQIRIYNPAVVALHLRPWEAGIQNPMIEVANGPFHSPISDLASLQAFRAHCWKTYAASIDYSSIEPTTYQKIKRLLRKAPSDRVRYAILVETLGLHKELPRQTLAEALGTTRQTLLRYEKLLPEIAQILTHNAPREIQTFPKYAAAEECAVGLNDTGLHAEEEGVQYTYAYFRVRRKSNDTYAVVTQPANTYHIPWEVFREKRFRFLGFGTRTLRRLYRRYRTLVDEHQAEHRHGRIVQHPSFEQLGQNRHGGVVFLPENITPITQAPLAGGEDNAAFTANQGPANRSGELPARSLDGMGSTPNSTGHGHRHSSSRPGYSKRSRSPAVRGLYSSGEPRKPWTVASSGSNKRAVYSPELSGQSVYHRSSRWLSSRPACGQLMTRQRAIGLQKRKPAQRKGISSSERPHPVSGFIGRVFDQMRQFHFLGKRFREAYQSCGGVSSENPSYHTSSFLKDHLPGGHRNQNNKASSVFRRLQFLQSPIWLLEKQAGIEWSTGSIPVGLAGQLPWMTRDSQRVSTAPSASIPQKRPVGNHPRDWIGVYAPESTPADLPKSWQLQENSWRTLRDQSAQAEAQTNYLTGTVYERLFLQAVVADYRVFNWAGISINHTLSDRWLCDNQMDVYQVINPSSADWPMNGGIGKDWAQE